MSQLLLTALDNDLCPGELPDEFEIKNIICTKESFEKLLEELGLNVLSVEFIKGHCANSFRVFLNI